MIPLQMGPSFTLDASSSGDSYFVKIKLKSVPTTPAACWFPGSQELLAWAFTQPQRDEEVDNESSAVAHAWKSSYREVEAWGLTQI